MSKLKKTRVVDVHASQLVSGYRAPEFVAVSKILPIVDVSSEAGQFMEFAADASVIRQNLKRALGDDRHRIEMRVGSDKYATNEFSVEVPIYDRELRSVPEERKQDYRDKKAILGEKTQQLLMEYTAAQILKDPAKYHANFTAALAGVNQWKETTSKPIKNLRDALRAVSFSTGIPVASLGIALAPKPWEALQDHAEIRDRVKYTGSDVTTQWLAQALQCGSVDLLAGMYASAFDADDPANVTFTNIFDDEVMVFPVIDKPTVADPLPGCIARHEDYPIVTEYRDEPKSADIIAVDDNWGVHWKSSQRRIYLYRTVSGL